MPYSPTQLNDPTDLFSCQWNSGTNETYSCTHPLPGAMLWRVKRAKLEFVEIAVKVDRQIYWLKLSKCFFVVFLSNWCQANKPVSSIVLFSLLFCYCFLSTAAALEVGSMTKPSEGAARQASRQVEPALPVANGASSIELQTESLNCDGSSKLVVVAIITII